MAIGQRTFYYRTVNLLKSLNDLLIPTINGFLVHHYISDLTWHARITRPELWASFGGQVQPVDKWSSKFLLTLGLCGHCQIKLNKGAISRCHHFLHLNNTSHFCLGANDIANFVFRGHDNIFPVADQKDRGLWERDQITRHFKQCMCFTLCLFAINTSGRELKYRLFFLYLRLD